MNNNLFISNTGVVICIDDIECIIIDNMCNSLPYKIVFKNGTKIFIGSDTHYELINFIKNSIEKKELENETE